MPDSYTIKDRSLPHFLTWTVHGWHKVFVGDGYKQVLVDCLNYCVAFKGLVVHAWVIMPDHVHLIAGVDPGASLSAVIRDARRHIARRSLEMMRAEPDLWSNALGAMRERANELTTVSEVKFWKDGSHALPMYNVKFLWQKLNYIHENPVRAGLCDGAEEYLHSSARDYAGRNGLVKLQLLKL